MICRLVNVVDVENDQVLDTHKQWEDGCKGKR